MVKVYAVALSLGVIGLVALVFSGAFAESTGKAGAATGRESSGFARLAVAGLIGLGMGGLSAEFSPLDLTWPVALAIAAGAALIAIAWVIWAMRIASRGP